MNNKLYQPLIFELSHSGRRGDGLPDYNYGSAGAALPSALLRSRAPELPETDEPKIGRAHV